MDNLAIDQLSQKGNDTLTHLKQEYSKLQTGRASAALVESLMVESYGQMTPLKGVATISVPEAKQIMIQPWDRDSLVAIEKAITESNLGLNPQNDGVVIRLNIPPMTEERRKELVKMVHTYAEDAKISVRNARHEALDAYKAAEKAKEISEDDLRGYEKKIQEVVDDLNKKVEEMMKQKETDVMTV